MTPRPYVPKGGPLRFIRGPLVSNVIAWTFLIGMFLSIWWLMRPGSAPTAPEASDDPFFWQNTIPKLFPAIFLGLMVLFVVRGHRFIKRQAAGLKAQADGDFADAENRFEDLAKSYRWIGPWRGVAQYQRGVARLHRGNIEGAIVLFTEVDCRVTLSSVTVRPAVACNLGLAYALSGDLESARRWRSETQTRMKSRPETPALSALLTFIDAVVDARESRYVETIRLLDERWRQLEGQLTARAIRPLSVIRAFAIAQSVTVRDASVLDSAPSRRSGRSMDASSRFSQRVGRRCGPSSKRTAFFQ